MSRIMNQEEWHQFCRYMGWCVDERLPTVFLASNCEHYDTDQEFEEIPKRKKLREDKPDCGLCRNCLDKRGFGGEGRRKQACLQRKLIVMN